MQDNGTTITYKQQGRTLIVESSLGLDQVVLLSMECDHAISRPFRVTLEFATSCTVGRVRRLLGQPVTAMFSNSNPDEQRPLHGLVRTLSGPTRTMRGVDLWRAELAPRLAFLGFTSDCRIFQHMTVPDIISAVFAAHKLSDYEFRGLTGEYHELEYCVQYRESALAFVSRLMEHVGLFYWHEFEHGAHKLVITDTNARARPALANPARLRAETDIEALVSDCAFRSGQWTLTDYDFTAPSTSLLANTPIIQDAPNMADYEMFDFPGLYRNVDEGKALTRLRIELEEMWLQTLRGSGWRTQFDAGRKVELEPHGAQAAGVPENLLLTRVQHFVSDRSGFSSPSVEPPQYRNEFEAIPAHVPFRPERVTPAPIVRGTQTAVVVGPPGEPIHTDEHGRVKLRFFWDRNPAGLSDEELTCWVRVSQAWADGSFGGVHLPRVGQEVIVDFLEGNPDRPIITGRVYNGDKRHPYALPQHKTQSGFKTQSVPSGGSNELRFEDKSGSEEIYVHAQKDHNHNVGHDHNVTIGNDHSVAVGHDHNVTVDNDYNIAVISNFTHNVAGNLTQSVAQNITQTADSSWSETTPLKNTNIGSNFSTYGSTFTTAGLNIAMYALYVQLPVVAITIAPLKLDVVAAKVEITKFKTASKSVEIEFGTLRVKQAALKAETVQAELKTLEARVTNVIQDVALIDAQLLLM